MRPSLRSCRPFVAALAWLLPACGGAADVAPGGASPAGTNLLLVVLDDVGLDAVTCYPGATDDVRTPHLAALARRGVTFDTVWANPWCSPTRATLLTGRYAFRSNIGSIVEPELPLPGLALDEVTIAEHLVGSDVATAFVGKWHLCGPESGPDHPRQQGFGHFRGPISNLGTADQPERYFRYEEVVDGERRTRERYATSATVDDTLEAVRRMEGRRWLVVASFPAAHMPFHDPPAELVHEVPAGTPQERPRAHFLAMVEALDHELGRLLDGLGPDVLARTHVVVVGDNGTPKIALPPGTDFDRGKGTLYEPGVRVPMIVAGPGVADGGRRVPHLVNTCDVPATCLELLGVAPRADAPALDGRSFARALARPDADPARTWLFAERFKPEDATRSGRAIDIVAARDGRWKLVENRGNGRRQLFDLVADPGEAHDLLEASEDLEEAAQVALASLTAVIGEELGR